MLEAERAASGNWQSFLAFVGIEPVRASYADRCRELNASWRYLPTRSGRPWIAWRPMVRWLEEIDPDVVVLHSNTSLLPCYWHARRHRVPLVVVEHKANVTKTKAEWVFTVLSMWLSNSVVLLTEAYGEDLSRRLGPLYRRRKISVIPNGISLDLFRPGPGSTRAQTGEIRLGMAARFSATKRQDLLVDVLARLQAARPDKRWRLTLAGTGEELERVKARRDAAGLGDRVVFEGALEEPDLAAWFRSLDVYVHATDGETLSTSLLQAMACRVPIVASDVPGVGSLFRDGSEPAAALVGNGELEGFAQAVEWFVDAPDEAKELSDRAYSLCHERYGQAAMFQRYDGLIRSLSLRAARGSRGNHGSNPRASG